MGWRNPINWAQGQYLVEKDGDSQPGMVWLKYTVLILARVSFKVCTKTRAARHARNRTDTSVLYPWLDELPSPFSCVWPLSISHSGISQYRVYNTSV